MSMGEDVRVDEENGKILPGEQWYNDDKSLFALAPDNNIRKGCKALAETHNEDLAFTLDTTWRSLRRKKKGLSVEGPAEEPSPTTSPTEAAELEEEASKARPTSLDAVEKVAEAAADCLGDALQAARARVSHRTDGPASHAEQTAEAAAERGGARDRGADLRVRC